MASCKVCEKTWSGSKICHCSECHQNFSTELNFDIHRRKARGKCGLMPKLRGMVQNTRGTWMMPGERDIAGLGLLRRAAPGDAGVADDPVPES